jgi:hypothetical protein
MCCQGARSSPAVQASVYALGATTWSFKDNGIALAATAAVAVLLQQLLHTGLQPTMLVVGVLSYQAPCDLQHHI